MPSIVEYFRRNAIALTALGCSMLALAGAGYAAVSLPAGSVGPPQLNRHLIGGYVRVWAHVSASGKVIAGSPGTRAVYNGLTGTTVPGPNYFVRWSRVKPSSRCAAIVTLDDNGPVSSRGSTAEAAIDLPSRKPPLTADVIVANAANQNVADNFYIAVVC